MQRVTAASRRLCVIRFRENSRTNCRFESCRPSQPVSIGAPYRHPVSKRPFPVLRFLIAAGLAALEVKMTSAGSGRLHHPH
jgi:hypothetical protein